MVKELNQVNTINANNNIFYLFIKRLFDIFCSLFFLLLFSWLIIIILLIKFFEDFHNPIYTSVRVGKNGKLIKFHKIRSMVPHAEDLKDELIKEGKNEADGPVFKMKNDPRITPFGRFLRKTSLDEIPQLWDVLVGRLSIIGPRSPLPQEVEKYNEYQMHRLDVKGGILCLWQIQKNRHNITFDQWIDLDIEYIQRRSVWLDLKILFVGAFKVVFCPDGE